MFNHVRAGLNKMRLVPLFLCLLLCLVLLCTKRARYRVDTKSAIWYKYSSLVRNFTISDLKRWIKEEWKSTSQNYQTRHLNPTGFTWKKTTLVVFFTAQCKSQTLLRLKHANNKVKKWRQWWQDFTWNQTSSLFWHVKQNRSRFLVLAHRQWWWL